MGRRWEGAAIASKNAISKRFVPAGFEGRTDFSPDEKAFHRPTGSPSQNLTHPLFFGFAKPLTIGFHPRKPTLAIVVPRAGLATGSTPCFARRIGRRLGLGLRWLIG